MRVRKFIFLKSELFPMSELISTESAPHDFIALAAEKRVAGEPWAAIARASGCCIRRGMSSPCRSTTHRSPEPYSVYSSRSRPASDSTKNWPTRSLTNMRAISPLMPGWRR